MGSASSTVLNAVGSPSYAWALVGDGQGTWTMTGQGTATVIVSVSGVLPSNSSTATLTLTVTDPATGLSATSNLLNFSWFNSTTL